MPQYSTHAKHHGRKSRGYYKGETPSAYGIAFQNADGEYEFISDYGGWSTTYGFLWRDPPHHYLVDDKGKIKRPGAFIVNYNKPTSPQPKTLRR